MEANSKKLRVINLNERKVDPHSPQINPPLKKPLYDQDYIRKYLAERALISANTGSHLYQSQDSSFKGAGTPIRTFIQKPGKGGSQASNFGTTMTSLNHQQIEMPDVSRNYDHPGIIKSNANQAGAKYSTNQRGAGGGGY